jgi:hypothetical protein
VKNGTLTLHGIILQILDDWKKLHALLLADEEASVTFCTAGKSASELHGKG